MPKTVDFAPKAQKKLRDLHSGVEQLRRQIKSAEKHMEVSKRNEERIHEIMSRHLQVALNAGFKEIRTRFSEISSRPSYEKDTDEMSALMDETARFCSQQFNPKFGKQFVEDVKSRIEEFKGKQGRDDLFLLYSTRWSHRCWALSSKA